MIDANDSSGLLVLDPRTADPMINRGTMRASGGGNLTLDAGPYDNADGIIEALDLSTVMLNSNASVTGGTFQTSGNGTVNVGSGQTAYIRDVLNSGPINLTDNSSLFIAGTIENNGEINVNSQGNTTSLSFNSPVVVAGRGAIRLPTTTSRMWDSSGSSNMEIIGNTVSGIGNVQSNSVFNGATIAPGNSVGALNFTGTTQIVNGTTIEIELQGDSGSPGVNWDYFNVTGTLDFDDDVLESGAKVKLKSLDQNGIPGLLDGFDQGQDYTWQIGNATAIEGFSSSFVIVDTSEFENDFSGIFTVTVGGPSSNQLLLNYVSQVTSVNADSVFPLRGILVDGTLEDTFESDNQYLEYRPGITLNSSEPPVWLEFEGTLPDSMPQWLNIKLESHANSPNIGQRIEMYNWLTEAYELVDFRQTSFNVDSTSNVAIPLPMNFVEAGTNRVKARMGWKANGFVLLYPWRVSIDRVVWLLL